MSGNFADNILDMEARIQLQRAQQGYGIQVSSVNPTTGALTLLGTLTGQGDFQYIGEWMKMGLILQIMRVEVTGVVIPPPFSWEYEIPQSIDGA